MSETPGTLELIARHLTLALRPLVEGLSDLPHFQQLMYRLGWKVTDLPPQFTALSTAVNTAVSKVHALREDPSADEIAELLQAVKKAHEAIRGISTAPSGVDAGAFLAEAGERLSELLLTDYFARELPRLYNLLLMLNVIQLEHQAATNNRPSFVHVRLEWAEIPRILSHPQDVPKLVYGWGTADLNTQRLVDHLSELFFAIGVPVNVEAPDRALAAKYADLVNEPPLNVARSLVVPFWFGKVAGQRLQAAFALRELPAAGSALPGLVIEPQIPSQFPVDFPLTETTTLRLRAGTNAGSLFGILIRPDDISIKYPFAPGTELPTVGFGLSLEYKPEGPTLLLGRHSASRLTMQGASVMLDLDRRESGIELRVGSSLNGLTLVLATQEQDGFLAELIGNEAVTIPIPLTIQWSSRTGVAFAGGAGVELSQAANLRVGPLTVQELRLALRTTLASGHPPDLIAEVGASIGGRIGPVAFSIENVGLRLTTVFQNGNAGPFDLAVGFKPPTGMGLVIDASVVLGGGFLRFDPQNEEYSGILQLEIAETIAVKAIGLLTTRLPDGSKGFSLVIIIAAEGFPPIQLGFGFTLTGIGGLLGVNRTVMADVLRSGLKNGTLGSILFPADPIRNAPHIVSDLRAVFPPVRDRYVFGPMAKIAWGTPTILTLEIGLLLELPEPVRLIILGRLQTVLPDPDLALIRVRMDAIGVIDFNKEEVSLDATLYESRILQFVLTGDMALRANWGRQATFVLAVGGFNPRFRAPSGFPLLARLALSLGDSDNPRLRFESYLALTSNTVQFGARFEFAYSAAGFTLAGLLAFDALFQFSPFQFIVDVGAMVALKRGSSVLMGVFLDMTVAGPTPWHIRGTATFKVLFFKVSIRFDHRFGDDPPPALPPAIDLLALVAEALGDRRNWTSALPRGEHSIVSLRETQTTTPVTLRVHPMAELTVRQRVVPLNVTVTRFGNVPLAAPTVFAVAVSAGGAASMPSTPVRDSFALAQFQEMSDDEKLARPAFELQDAGLYFAAEAAAYQYDALPDTSIAYETLIIDPTRPAETATAPQPYVMPPAVLDAVVSLGAAGQSAIRRRGSSRYRTPEPLA